MKILSFKTICGPNLYHSSPVLMMKLDLEEMITTTSADIPGFIDRLLDLLPGLKEHRCSPGYPGGFVERLHRGTYFGHIIEHIALEMSRPAGIEVGFGKTVHVSDSRVYNVVVRFVHEEGMKFLLRQAVILAQKVAAAESFDFATTIEQAKDIIADGALGPSTRSIVDEADKRQIPWRRIGKNSLIEFGYGRGRRRIQAAVTDQTGLISTELVQDKQLTKEMLESAEIPVPRGFVTSSQSELIERLDELRLPCVIKPLDGHHGKGVCMDISTPDQARLALAEAQEYSDDVLVEEQVQGRDYRVLVVNYNVVAVAEREPAHVVGDGKRTVRELIEIVNRDPRRGSGHSNVLTALEMDEKTELMLSRQNLSLDAIPTANQRVLLRQTANLSTGGTARDVTDLIHPGVKAMCERAARIVGLDICGIDLIHSDIAEPIGRKTAIIEVNAGPGLRMHVAPTEGQGRNVGGAILDMLYPKPENARIPIVSVTGTNGKTTTARLIAHITSQIANVGLTSSDGIMINGHYIERGDTTGPRSARAVLADPGVELAVLETARGGIVRNGLGYDWSDVGIVTNIRPDHIGQDGIETLEDLVRIKGLVAERVKASGTLILNADDPESSRLVQTLGLSSTKRNYVYISTDSENPLISEHLRSGYRVFCVRDGWITEFYRHSEFRIVPIRNLQFAYGGSARYHVSNALAAAAASRALGCSIELTRAGLESFRNSVHNAGRSNLFKVGKGHILVDYGHNPDALASTGDMLKQWRISSATAILGLPGDRETELILESGRVAAEKFSKLILRDDHDRRGRAVGEVPQLLKRELEGDFPGLETHIVLDEGDAIRFAIEHMMPGELIAVFHDKYDSVIQALMPFQPVAVDEIPLQSVTSGNQKSGDHPESRRSSGMT